jgi:putative peptide zinc metalloprotease protein
LAGIAYAWFPNADNYRPIQASERGTLSDILYAVRVESTDQRTVSNATQPVAAARPLAAGQRGVMPALWDTRTPPPTVNNPQLAVILVPRPVATATPGGGGYFAAPAATPAGDQGWVFPFDKPLAPEDGDNQALAVNTTDGSLVYDVAFAMVWVTDNSDAMNVNEAHAYASCDSCGAVAVAYQVVLVVDTAEADDNVAVPQNLAGALNYDCVNCMTYALARQLFVTIDRPLSEEEMAALHDALDEVWAEVAAYEQAIESGEIPPEVWVNEIDGKLAEWNAEILVVLDPYVSDPTLTPTQTATAPTTATPATPVLAPSATVPPPTSPAPEPTGTTAATAPAESTTESTTSAPTPSSSEPTPTAATPEPSGTTDPSASTDPTSGGSVGSTTGDSTSDGSTSGGSATTP